MTRYLHRLCLAFALRRKKAKEIKRASTLIAIHVLNTQRSAMS